MLLVIFKVSFPAGGFFFLGGGGPQEAGFYS